MTDRRLTGEITDVALLDLTPMTSAEDLAGITRISDAAIVLVPQSLMGAAAAIPMDDVAMVVPAVPTLSGTWWSDFNDKISTAIARATATPAPALAALP